MFNFQNNAVADQKLNMTKKMALGHVPVVMKYYRKPGSLTKTTPYSLSNLWRIYLAFPQCCRVFKPSVKTDAFE